MAFVVRAIGPEFLTEESRDAFMRVEESIRQYAAHTRESIYLIRRPLALPRDHFVLLWSHGSAVVGLYNRGGSIHGGRSGAWSMSERAGDHDRAIAIENPFSQLMASRAELAGTIRRATAAKKVVAGEETSEIPPVTAPVSEGPEGSSKVIALFTRPVLDLQVDDATFDSTFVALSLDEATGRTMFHLPNLLQAIDRQVNVYSNIDLRAIADDLEKAALGRVANGSTFESVPENTDVIGNTNPRRKRNGSRSRVWIFATLVLVAIVIVVAVRSIIVSKSKAIPDSTNRPSTSVIHPPSQIVIELPAEIQVYVSPSIYHTRSELDRSLAQGEGQRYLPSTEQILVLDSITFAKGVYGYFKVDNAWRKGKLLQTFQTHDTIKIDNFLAPLP